MLDGLASGLNIVNGHSMRRSGFVVGILVVLSAGVCDAPSFISVLLFGNACR